MVRAGESRVLVLHREPGVGKTALLEAGSEARCRALLTEGEAADRLYRESIERLSRSQLDRVLPDGQPAAGGR